jgi:hypothetical protein
MQLQIRNEDLPAFLACLGIGTLHAIREGTVPPQVGIWTLGPPRMWEPLAEIPGVPGEIIAVFRVCDELSALQQLVPDQSLFTSFVTELITRLQVVLAQIDDPAWITQWNKDAE